MTYTLRLLTEESRDLVVEALLAESDKRTRVAQGAAQHVAADKAAGVKDVRSSAVRVAMLLAEAGTLADLARELRAAADGPLVTRIVGVDPAQGAGTGIVIAETAPPYVFGPTDVLEEDDGLSDAAHAAMAAAEEFADEYLEDPDGTDVDTHALGEDEPAAGDVVEVLP